MSAMRFTSEAIGRMARCFGVGFGAFHGDEHAAEEAQRKIEAKGADWLDAIKAAMRGFSIYDDLKDALVEMGIPENEVAFIHDYNTDEQKAAVRARDLNWMMSTGGNIYFLSKLGATDGLSFQQMAGSMTGMTEEAYRNMMINGGRSIEGNRYLHEQKK